MLRIKNLIFFFFIFLLLLPGLQASNNLPNLNAYNKQDYGAGRQNWDIDIDKYGVVYFGNTDGLLFNVYGEWGLASMPGKGAVRAVLTDNDTIWCGGEEYGYFTKIDGRLSFHKLGELDGGQVWNIEIDQNLVIFQSENIIIHYNKQDNSLSSKDYEEGIWAMTRWQGKMWMVLRDGQMGYLVDGDFHSVDRAEIFVNREVRKLFVYEDQLYILMFEGGLYRYNATKLSRVSLPAALEGKTLFTGMSFDDHSLCLGTVSEGFIQLGARGEILKSVNSEHGLLDNTVLSMAKDELGNLWLGLDYGIAKIELQSAINPIFEGAATYSIVNLQGSTYLATNKGLFKSRGSGDFEFVENSGGQTWAIREMDKELYVCHNSGLMKIEGQEIKALVEFSGFLDIAHFEGSNYYLGSTYHGLILMHGEAEHFYWLENLRLWGNTRLVYDGANQCIWAALEDKNVFKLSLNPDFSVLKEECPGVTAVYETARGIFFSNNEELLNYSNGEFHKPDHPLLNLVEGAGIVALDFNREGNAIAYIQDREIKLDVLLPDGNVHTYNTLLQSFRNMLVAEFELVDLEGDILRLATDRGVTTFDFSHRSAYKKSSRPVISSMTVLNEQHLQRYYPFPQEGISFASGNKDLIFRFNINKSDYDLVEYRYRLAPKEESWSEWSTDIREVLFSQLRGGSYKLSLQSRINGGGEDETSLSFTIDKLWYQTGWLALPISLFTLIWVFGIVFVMLRYNKSKLQKQKQHYKQRDAQKTLAMKNEQLLQYTEIISHKNELLNKVKGGLESMRNSEAQRWASLITSEVNNEKKEFLFHKLFSEIHQDFITRLTDQYPSLTSNDVRILSFIRINLDKNEICNLMNISPRSLDTNRYRLRKKLDLDHSTDLNQFIRDL